MSFEKDSFFSDQQHYELIFADLSISVLVYLLKNLFYFFSCFFRTIQKGFHLLYCDVSWVVCIEVGERVFELFLLEELLFIAGSHQKLREIYPSRAVGVDEFQDIFDLFMGKSASLGVKNLNQFFFFNDPISVFVDFSEGG